MAAELRVVRPGDEQRNQRPTPYHLIVSHIAPSLLGGILLAEVCHAAMRVFADPFSTSRVFSYYHPDGLQKKLENWTCVMKRTSRIFDEGAGIKISPAAMNTMMNVFVSFAFGVIQISNRALLDRFVFLPGQPGRDTKLNAVARTLFSSVQHTYLLYRIFPLPRKTEQIVGQFVQSTLSNALFETRFGDFGALGASVTGCALYFSPAFIKTLQMECLENFTAEM